MFFFSTLAFLLSLVSANFLSRGGPIGDPSYDSATYHWECGETVALNISDCEPVFAQIRNISAANEGRYNFTHWPSRYWSAGSCKVTIDIDTLPQRGLLLYTEEMISIGRWGVASFCNQASQRAMVRPQNNTWRLYLTEPSWNPLQAFTAYSKDEV
ncbi:hypothetical protein NM208_g9137 [Fusarium decemcellulare]|uniref:Uncharacterized protein n=1 Tax=Fusarium decemcellulare TaxID=57161 RepID=A0ACC1S2N2_9HYPO|nr:hypothetical protein NM208_g9137 [Fusarium decemcellulare]